MVERLNQHLIIAGDFTDEEKSDLNKITDYLVDLIEADRPHINSFHIEMLEMLERALFIDVIATPISVEGKWVYQIVRINTRD